MSDEISLAALVEKSMAGRTRNKLQIPPELHPFYNTPAHKGPDGRARCRWCGVLDGDGRAADIHKKCGLCRWCIKTYIEDKGRRCLECGEPSRRRLQGICIACRRKAEHIPENLEALKLLKWVGQIP